MAGVETVWVYCPGHAGIDLNETADRLASRASGATSRILLSASDIRHLLIQKQREADKLTRPRKHRGGEDARERTGAGLGLAFASLWSDWKAGLSAGVWHHLEDDAG